MLILDPGSATDRAEAFAWADAVVGHLCGNEDVKDSILMVLLMPAVRLTNTQFVQLLSSLVSDPALALDCFFVMCSLYKSPMLSSPWMPTLGYVE